MSGRRNAFALRQIKSKHQTYHPAENAPDPSKPSAFDIDAVDQGWAAGTVSARETVDHFGVKAANRCRGRAQGRRIWNNDWDAALELLRPPGQQPLAGPIRPTLQALYFGANPGGDPPVRRLNSQRTACWWEALLPHAHAAGIAWGIGVVA